MGTYLGRLCPYPPPWVPDGQHSVTSPTNWPAMTTGCACISIYFKAILHYVCASLAAMPCSLIPEIVYQDPKGPVPFLEFPFLILQLLPSEGLWTKWERDA